MGTRKKIFMQSSSNHRQWPTVFIVLWNEASFFWVSVELFLKIWVVDVIVHFSLKIIYPTLSETIFIILKVSLSSSLYSVGNPWFFFFSVLYRFLLLFSMVSLSITLSWSLLKFMSIESVLLSHHLISATLFSFCPQSFPASGSFPGSQFFTSGRQSIGASTSTSVFPMNIQGWSPLGWTGWISLQSKALSRVFSNTTVQNHQFFGSELSFWSSAYIRTWLPKNHRFDCTDLCQKSDIFAL